MAIADPATRSIEQVDDDTHLDLPYHVFLWNDPVTPMQIVVLVLKRIFGYGEHKATELMLVAHRKGKAVVWTGERERAIHYSIQLGTAGLHSTVGREA